MRRGTGLFRSTLAEPTTRFENEETRSSFHQQRPTLMDNKESDECYARVVERIGMRRQNGFFGARCATKENETIDEE